MDYTEIEIEGMKEILRDKEEYIKKIEEKYKRLEELYDASNINCINKTIQKCNLEMENNKLKAELEEADKAKMDALNGMSDLSSFGLEYTKKLEKEIKKLNEELEKSKECGKFRQEENKELKEKIRFLEQCLDNKEKVNKSLREELEWYHGFDNYLTNHGFDMKNLKDNIKNQN